MRSAMKPEANDQSYFGVAFTERETTEIEVHHTGAAIPPHFQAIATFVCRRPGHRAGVRP